MLVAFNHPYFPRFYAFVFLERIVGVGVSSDGGTIVSVDDGSWRNVVAFDAASGWIILFLVLFIKM